MLRTGRRRLCIGRRLPAKGCRCGRRIMCRGIVGRRGWGVAELRWVTLVRAVLHRVAAREDGLAGAPGVGEGSLHRHREVTLEWLTSCRSPVDSSPRSKLGVRCYVLRPPAGELVELPLVNTRWAPTPGNRVTIRSDCPSFPRLCVAPPLQGNLRIEWGHVSRKPR